MIGGRVGFRPWAVWLPVDPGRFDACYELDRVELGSRVAWEIAVIHSHRSRR